MADNTRQSNSSQEPPWTCLSSEPHTEIKEHLVHYLGCLEFHEREKYFHEDHPVWQKHLDHLGSKRPSKESALQECQKDREKKRDNCMRELRRIKTLRLTMWDDKDERRLIECLQASKEKWKNYKEYRENIDDVRSWREKNGKPNGVSHPETDTSDKDMTSVKDRYDFEKDINVHILQFSEGKHISIEKKEDSRVQSTFPDQKFKVEEIFREGKNKDEIEKHILYRDRFKDRITYFHLPANNMRWAEEAVSRYYGQSRPNFHMANRELVKERTPASLLLKKSHWRGQVHGERSNSTSIFMKPFCEAISTNTEKVDHAPKNLVLFMPYLHWETSRQRERFAIEIDKFIGSKTSELKNKEHDARSRRQEYRVGLTKRKFDPPVEKKKDLDFVGKTTGTLNPSEPTPEHGEGVDQQDDFQPRRLCHTGRVRTIGTAVRMYHRLKGSLPLDKDRRVKARNPLAQYLIDAARLFEAMTNYRDKQLVKEYLTHDPPLHPRRTLDQAYYWSLHSTGNRDRDQVVYRATTPRWGSFHAFDDETKSWPDHKDQAGNDKDMDPCEDCRTNIRKVSRVVMVDQLWMWILDERTIITCFPKRYGSNKHDQSGVHKSIRVRFESEMDNEIKSVFDLALVVFDECFNGLFDSTKVADKKPEVLEAFSEAIGNIMNKHTVAFGKLWRWTEMTRIIFLSQSQGRFHADLDIPFLDINPEGELEREIKDIIEELGIMIFITKTQRDMLKQFVSRAKSILGDRYDGLIEPFKDKRNDTIRESDMNASKKKEIADAKDSLYWFSRNAEELTEKVNTQIEQLEEMKRNAEGTASNVKDLLDLKQQQASVVQAWQSVKQSEEAMQQGRSIMVFTIVTIIFLPLSFMSSIFGMNAFELDENKMSFREEITYIIPISFSVAIIAIFFSLSKWIRTLIWCGYHQLITWIWCSTGLYWLFLHADMKKLQNSANKFVHALKNAELERFKQGRREHYERKRRREREGKKREAEKNRHGGPDQTSAQEGMPEMNSSKSNGSMIAGFRDGFFRSRRGPLSGKGNDEESQHGSASKEVIDGQEVGDNGHKRYRANAGAE